MRYVPLLAALLVASLSACGTTDPEEDGGLASSNFLSVFEPAPAVPTGGVCPTAAIPFPFDGLFSGFTDPTLNIPNAANIPFVNDANLTDGFSTTANMFTDFVGFIDIDTALQGGLLIIDTSTGTPLAPGVDYTLSDFPATDQTLACANGQFTGPAPTFDVPINALRTRLVIHPLKPLKPSTRYLIAVTDRVRDLDGNAAVASSQFRVVRRDTPVAEQADPFIVGLNPTQRGTLEALRVQLIRPAVEALIAATADTLGLTEDNIVLAWTVTTQSAGKTLGLMAAEATPQAIASFPTGLTVDQALQNPNVPPVADVRVGSLELPYYLENSGGSPQGAAPLSSRWFADPTRPDVQASFLGQVPCGAFVQPPAGTNFVPSVSTTTCFPIPVARSVESVPILITVPNANSGMIKPDAGWPVVIFQHGITGDRSQMLALAPAMAAAGFVTVAIDLPLHGLPAGHPLAVPGTTERTFLLDLVDNTTQAPGPDGATDPSGTHFINLPSVITSRDNLRQAAIDLVHVSRSVSQLNFDGDVTTADINPDRIHLVGHSLGGIVGTTALGIDDSFGASTIAMSGSGIGKLLDGSKTFGPRIAAGLAASGVVEGTDTFETFLRFAQHVVDDGDPANYAAAASGERAIHFAEIVDDLVVPNAVPRNPVASDVLDRVTLEGRVSGSTPLMRLLGLTILDPITPPLAEAQPPLLGERLKVGVRFTVGDHGSILSPVASPAATQEIQRQIANFLASQGSCLPVGGNCP
jgi:pimeloyl-ACP methyl ester carboxylesterase